MLVKDEELIRELGKAVECGYCGRKLRYRSQVHHVYGKGAGRVDLRCNLIPLGGPWDCGCHGRVHDGHVPMVLVLRAAARRERVTPDSVTALVYAVRRAPKGANLQAILEEHLKPAA